MRRSAVLARRRRTRWCACSSISPRNWRNRSAVGDPWWRSMDDKTKKPAGYGHDNKGAALGGAVGGGRPGVAHSVAADKSAGAGEGATAQTFFIDDREIDIRKGETIFRAARRLDIKLPHLCYSPKPGYRPDGNCRVCMVEIEGDRKSTR